MIALGTRPLQAGSAYSISGRDPRYPVARFGGEPFSELGPGRSCGDAVRRAPDPSSGLGSQTYESLLSDTRRSALSSGTYRRGIRSAEAGRCISDSETPGRCGRGPRAGERARVWLIPADREIDLECAVLAWHRRGAFDRAGAVPRRRGVSANQRASQADRHHHQVEPRVPLVLGTRSSTITCRSPASIAAARPASVRNAARLPQCRLGACSENTAPGACARGTRRGATQPAGGLRPGSE